MNPAQRPALPHIVFAASYLFAGVGVFALVSSFGGLATIREFSYVNAKLAHDDAAGTLAGFGLAAFGIFGIVFAVLCVVLAILNAKGSKVARVLTWILGGLTILFNLLLVVTAAFESLMWYQILARISAVVMLIFAAAAITLLALPASQRYFDAAQAFRMQQRPRPPMPLAPHPPPYAGHSEPSP